MFNQDSNPMEGLVNQEGVFIILFLAHIVTVASLVGLYIYRRRRRNRKSQVIIDTIDSLLEEHESEPEIEPPQTSSKTQASNLEDTLELIRKMPRLEFVSYIGKYFEAAGYRVIDLVASTQGEVHNEVSIDLIIEKNGKKGLVLIDQPETNITGLPKVKALLSNKSPSGSDHNLILITTGSLSPKSHQLIKLSHSPVIAITGQQLATSIHKMKLAEED